MHNNVYDHAASGVRQNTILRKAYGLLGLSALPCAAGAYLGGMFGFSLYAALGNGWAGIIAVFAFFYGMIFLIEKNRYSAIGSALFMVFTFGMGVLIAPLLQLTLNLPNGEKLVGTAAVMTAAVFLAMSALAHNPRIQMNGVGRFLSVGGIVLLVAIVANLFFQLPAVSLAISACLVIFSSLLIMHQTRMVIDGGEDSHISAALTIFISLYNIFSSLLRILGALSGDD